MVKVEFRGQYRGVKEVVCHHVVDEGEDVVLHFTKNIFWTIACERIEQVTPVSISLPNDEDFKCFK